MNLRQIVALLAAIGMEIREDDSHSVTAHSESHLVGIDTKWDVTVWQDGHVVMERTRSMDASKRQVALAGSQIDISGNSVETLVWRSKLRDVDQVRKLVEMSRDGDAASRRIAATGFPAPAWRGAGN